LGEVIVDGVISISTAIRIRDAMVVSRSLISMYTNFVRLNVS
jgi:hypothetical protein